MLAGSTQFTTELQNGVRLIWLLSWDSAEGSISLDYVNFTIDPLGQVFIRDGSKRSIVGRTSCISKEDGFVRQLGHISTEVSYGHT